MKLEINKIALPPHYVRAKTDNKNMKDLFDLIVKANTDLVPKTVREPEYKHLKGKELVWPFNSNVLVSKLPTPTPGVSLDKDKVGEKKGKGKKARKEFKPFELMDGHHRLTLWKKLGQKSIPVDEKTIRDPAKRFEEQYTTNVGHGLRLNKDERDNYVRIAHSQYRVSLKALSKQCGLDFSSIKRIMAHKQRIERARMKPADKKTFPANVATLNLGEMTPTQFNERIEILVSAFPKLAPALGDWVKSNFVNSNRSKVGDLVARLRSIAAVYEAPLKDTNGKGENKDAKKEAPKASPAPIPEATAKAS